jgi:hypothetical protein
MSPPQAAAAAAAAVAAAAAEAAARVARESQELDTTVEFLPTPRKREREMNVGEDARATATSPIRSATSPARPSTAAAAAAAAAAETETETDAAAPAVDTHFLRKDGGNQPAVMSSIAGLREEEENSRDKAFEEALERVRQSRREIADKAAKGFEDMRAYYEAELEEVKRAGGSGSTAMPPPPPTVEAVAAAAARAESADRSAEGSRRKAFAWDLDEGAMNETLAREREARAAARENTPRDSVWPGAWNGSYSPPREVPADPPYPLPKQWTSPPKDRANLSEPPEVTYPHDEARKAAAMAAAVAAKQRADENGGVDPLLVPATTNIPMASAPFSFDSTSGAGKAKDAKSPKPTPPRPSKTQLDFEELQDKHAREVAAYKAAAERAAAASARDAAEYDSTIKKLKEEIAALERREAAAERAAETAERKAETTLASSRDLANRLQARDAEVRELGHQSAVLKEQAASEKTAAEEATRKLSNANAELNKRANELRDERMKREAFERSIADLNAKLDAMKRENIATQAKLSRAEDETSRAREKLAAATEKEKESARYALTVSKESEVVRRESAILRSSNQKSADATADAANALQAAKQEIIELRRRCKHLEKDATTRSMASAPAVVAPSQFQTQTQTRAAYASQTSSEGMRAVMRSPERAPSGRARLGPGRDRDENVDPDAPAAGRATTKDISTTSNPIWNLGGVDAADANDPGPDDLHDRSYAHVVPEQRRFVSPPRARAPADHFGPGMVPVLGAGARQPGAESYGWQNAGRVTSGNIGVGMVERSDARKEEVRAERRERAMENAAAEQRQRDAAEADAAARRRKTIADQARAAAAERDRAAAEAAAKRAAAEEAAEEARRAAYEAARDRRPTPPAVAAAAAAANAATTHAVLETAADRYSAAEAKRRGREGSGWFGGHLDGPEPVAKTGKHFVRAGAGAGVGASTDAAPWRLAAEEKRPTHAAPAADANPAAREKPRPFATTESYESWSSHLEALESRLTSLSLERDRLEGELDMMPEGAGKTIAQRRKKTECERRLEDVSHAQTEARHQLKAAHDKYQFE